MPFTPRSLPSLFAWWDFSDESSLTVSGGYISQANDKSGNGRHLVQAVGNNQPSLSLAARNGKSVAKFDGTDDRLSANVGSTSLGPACTALLVCRATGIASPFLFHLGTTFRVNRSSATSSFSIRNVGISVSGSPSQRSADSSFAADTWRLFCVRVTGSGDTLTGVLPRVGRADSTAGLTGTVTPAAETNSTLWVASNGGTASFLNGDIAELLIYNGSLSDGNVLAAESYLATRWGL